MAHIEIPTTLIEHDKDIIEGLATGSLKRFGGVVRDAGTGHIVRHLLEAPRTTESLMQVPGPALLRGGSFPLSAAVAGIHEQVGATLQLAQVAAAASVINLGVSLVGFAYMARKLQRLQKAIESVHEAMLAGFARVEERLVAIAGQLAYLVLLAESSRAEQERIRNELAELHRTTLVRELADLYAVLAARARFADTPQSAIARVAARVRWLMADQARRAAAQLDPCVLATVDVATQGWAAATTAEAYVLLEAGQSREARELLAAESAQFKAHAERWATALLSDERRELCTAYRFAASRFREHVLPERVERIVRISPRDRGLLSEDAWRRRREAELELDMSHMRERAPQWDYEQIAIAEFLDGLSELAARLESVHAVAALCDETGAKARELMLGPDARPGLYTLDPAAMLAKG
ncbi:MAG: hypothetical protein RMK74_12055 [Myxococcales bacterium]|nr:hypothetical protein [Myxococcales bacterium]